MTLTSSTSPASTGRTVARTSTRRTAARAAVALMVAAVLAGCLPPGSAMPSVTTAHVNVPAMPVAAVPNIVLDGATFESIAVAACASSPVPDSATFFGSVLGQQAISSLAGGPASLDQQRAYLGAAFTSGYYGGRALHDDQGVFIDTAAGSPFAALTPLIGSSTTIVALNQLVGQVLLVANGDAAAVQASIAAMTPLLAQLAAAAQHNFGATNIPDAIRPLFAAIVGATQAALAAATAGVAGNLASARQAEAAAAGIIGWAGGYLLGITAETSDAVPTLSC